MCKERRELKMSDIELTSRRYINVDLTKFTPVERAMIISKFNEDRGVTMEDFDDGTITFLSYELCRLNDIVNRYESERLSEVK